MANKRQMTFEANENVLCFHGPLLYEAKVKHDTLNMRLLT
jgi:mortality factor 4-like protein 1